MGGRTMGSGKGRGVLRVLALGSLVLGLGVFCERADAKDYAFGMNYRAALQPVWKASLGQLREMGYVPEQEMEIKEDRGSITLPDMKVRMEKLKYAPGTRVRVAVRPGAPQAAEKARLFLFGIMKRLQEFREEAREYPAGVGAVWNAAGTQFMAMGFSWQQYPSLEEPGGWIQSGDMWVEVEGAVENRTKVRVVLGAYDADLDPRRLKTYLDGLAERVGAAPPRFAPVSEGERL